MSNDDSRYFMTAEELVEQVFIRIEGVDYSATASMAAVAIAMTDVAISLRAIVTLLGDKTVSSPASAQREDLATPSDATPRSMAKHNHTDG